MAIINTLTTLALFSAATGIFFSLLFLTIKGNKAFANKLLSILLLTFSIRLAEIALYWTNYIWDFPHVYALSAPLPFLFGVLIYFYIKFSQKNNEERKYQIIFHFIPFVLYVIYLFPTFMQSAESKLSGLQNITSQEPVFGTMFYTFRTLKLIHMIIYAVLAFTLINNGGNSKSNGQNTTEIRWHKYLVIGFTVFIIITGLQTFGIAISGYEYIKELDSALMLSCIFLIYSSIYFTVRNPDIIIDTLKKIPLLKYERSSLTEVKSEEYANAILNNLEKEKSYLNPDLKLSNLSKTLSVPVHHLSQVINEKFDLSFNDLINKYRIQDAQELLKNSEYEKFTILTIAFEVGFTNKATFNSAFKKFTRQTPSEFKKSNLGEVRAE